MLTGGSCRSVGRERTEQIPVQILSAFRVPFLAIVCVVREVGKGQRKLMPRENCADCLRP